MKKSIVVATIALVCIALAFVFLSPMISTNATKTKAVKEFTVQAFRFGYEPDTITVNKGDLVEIKINNSDVPHGIRIPDFNIAGKDGVEFVANKTGSFTWYCYIPCGPGHGAMSGTLVVQ